MYSVFILAAIVSLASAFGPFTVPLVTKTTTPPIDCHIVASPFTKTFCEYKPERLYKHPNHPKWFISCGGLEKTGSIGGVCLRCDDRGVLELNEDCQMCLAPGAQCPKSLPPPVEMYCPDDGCPFCPSSGYVNGGFTHHRNPQNYCQCVWGDPKCMPCPCQQIFHETKKCCVNHPDGRVCPKHE